MPTYEEHEQCNQRNGKTKLPKENILQRPSYGKSFSIKEFDWTPNQQKLIDLVLDKESKIILVKGPAGSSKSLVATFCGLQLLKKGLKEILYIRNPVESSSEKLGFLPGSLEEKINPYMTPLWDKAEELLTEADLKNLNNDKRLTPCPINFLRGRSFNGCYMYIDEAQNLTVKDLLTCITRMGKYSKVFICGDTRQSDIKDSGFAKVYKLFERDMESAEHGIYTFSFGIDDIMRDESLKFIIRKFEQLDN